MDYKESAKGVFKDFDHVFMIKDDEKLRIDYQKNKDQSVITTKLVGEKKIKETFYGLKILRLDTGGGDLKASVR